MKALIKKCAALVLAAATALSLAAGIQAATTIYSVKIQKNSILVQNKGKTVQTYNAKSTDLTLSREDGELLLGYKNAQNLSRDIALGTQSTLTVEGTVSSLSLDSSLPTSMRLVLDTGSSVSSLKIAAPGKITIRGKVDTLTVSSAARITVSKGGAVTDATLTSGSAVLTAGTGAQVKNATVVKKSSVSGSGIGTVKVRGSDSDDDNDDDTTTDDGLTVKTSTISARSGDTLRDLESDLNHYVKVYDEDGDRIDGKAEWVSSYSTKVKKTGTFKFDFYPDDDDYDTVRGTIKISVSGGDDDDSTNDDGLTVKPRPSPPAAATRCCATLKAISATMSRSMMRMATESTEKLNGFLPTAPRSKKPAPLSLISIRTTTIMTMCAEASGLKSAAAVHQAVKRSGCMSLRSRFRLHQSVCEIWRMSLRTASRHTMTATRCGETFRGRILEAHRLKKPAPIPSSLSRIAAAIML